MNATAHPDVPNRADGTPYPTRTVRMFGRCAGTRCRTRFVVEVTAYEQGGREIVVEADRARMAEVERAAMLAGCLAETNGRFVVQDNGSILHGTVIWTGLKARYDASIKCTARCSGGRGFECKCECGGENHGTSAVQ